MTDTKTKRHAKRLRTFRKIHRITGAFLFIFFFVVSITGLLLGWKKHSQGVILPKTQKGISTSAKDWKSLDELQLIAKETANKVTSPTFSSDEIDRIDVRPTKGVVKFIFAEDNNEIQIDLTTGQVLSIDKRYSDLIEKIHDGSILDLTISTSDDYFKLFYTSLMGISLAMFTITGFWLWFGPKRLRKLRESEKQNE